MDVNSQLEKSCTALALLFQQVIIDMKNSSPVWEDFTSKATKLHSTLRSTVTAATAFLEAFQKVADMATSTRGATRDIGSALTRLCMRHRNIESKLKTVTSAIMDAMVMPLQEKMEDWKKVIVQLEKDRNRETKKSQQDIKKAVAETARLQKKLKKGRPEVQKPLEASIRDLREKLQTLEENEKIAVRAALTEERARYCLLIECIKPFMDGEISLLGDVTHLQEIMDSLCRQSVHPMVLPEASEQIITDISTNESSSTTWTCQIPSHHQSPAHSMSSSKSSLSSLSSSSNSSSLSPGHRCQPPRTNSESFTDSLIDGSSSSASSAVNPGYSVMNSSICSHWPGSPPLRVSRQRDICDERPHTISSAYERSHARTALTSNTFQPPPFHVNSVPTTPNPHIMCMRAVRARPHSLIRNVELAKLFERGEAMIRRQDEADEDVTGMTASVDSSITNRLQSHASISSAGDLMQSGQNLPCRGRNGREEGRVSLRKQNHNLNTDKGCWIGGHPAVSASSHQQGVLQQGKFTEADDRKVSMDDVQQTVKARLIHHSLSCSVIVNEQLPTVIDNGGHSNTNGNIYEHIYSEVPRRSSMFISERPPPPPPSTRRLSSMVACGEIVEDHTGQTLCFLDQHRTSSGPHGGRLMSAELNQASGPSHHMHRSRSEHRPKIDESTDHSEDFILPPSPFRSPDDLDDQIDPSTVQAAAQFSTGFTDRHVPQNFVMQVTENAAGERMCGQAWKTGGHERRALDSEKEFLDERLRNPWQEMSTLLTMAISPDDTTPTNENQPSIFAASQKTHFVGCHIADGLNNSAAEVVKDADQMETGTNRESAI